MPGRPFQNLTSPIVEGEVAGAVLLDAQLRLARFRGIKVSERTAAKWAAAAIRERFEIVSDLTFAGAPPSESAQSGRRSPTTKALSNGYRELKLMDRKNPGTELYFDSLADRLRKRRRALLRRKETSELLLASSADLADAISQMSRSAT